MLQNEKILNDTQANDSKEKMTKKKLFIAAKRHEMVLRIDEMSQMFTSINMTKVKKEVTRKELEDLRDYECIGWRQTKDCSPLGTREYENDENCSALIPNGRSGYCEVRNTRTGEVKRVMEMHCNSLRRHVMFKCDLFQSLQSHRILSMDYEHDPNFSYTHNQEVFRATNRLSDTPTLLGDDGKRTSESHGELELSFDRGIAYVVYEKMMLGAYVSVRLLRTLGCTLPIEVWYKPSEMSVEHPLLQLMVTEYKAYLRVIEDESVTSFFTKLYALFYSAFDNVLLLDADNFAVRDPKYLFDTQEFLETGAIFWPDFWKPGNTIFNINKESYLWEFIGLDYINAFEQESGQVLINRRMHYKALNLLMYYGFSKPRPHDYLNLMWGDKDLFRFSWIKSSSSFHMIERPPGSAGTKHKDHDLFCGVAMVQHDPSGNVIFLHRNTLKLTYTNNQTVWTHIQQYKRTALPLDHRVRGANGGKFFPQFKRCFGKDVQYHKFFTLKPMSEFPFANLEHDILRFAAAAANIIDNAKKSGSKKSS
ncbi:unnamed protein product [Peronospora belbahrii]|uniref:Uncharacterized protein n=3 Tax=Peronospora belbahrii TaxID=622444 RepID=A0ABN8D3P3_9STRA|nr:unnamed protein product [Peronospora belbahrii]